LTLKINTENFYKVLAPAQQFQPQGGLRYIDSNVNGVKNQWAEPMRDETRMVLEREFMEVEKKMGGLEKELNENFGMNAIQKNNKKKEFQSLLVMRSNILQKLENL
jgi:lipoate-protein ligase A